MVRVSAPSPLQRPLIDFASYSRFMPRVWRSAHHNVKANPMKAAVIAPTMMAVSVVIVGLPVKESTITQPVDGSFDRNQISRG
jgi:hypothetical protein